MTTGEMFLDVVVGLIAFCFVVAALDWVIGKVLGESEG